MNKKIEDTNEKIYNAFSEVLLLKDYNDVRIQDVLDKSGVARSTFYAHYKTKEDLLKSVCTTIFSHVFSHVLKEEKSHDFSRSSIFDYKHFITHIFYHIKDESRLIHAILLSQSKAIFLDYMRGRRQGVCDRVRRQRFRRPERIARKTESQKRYRKFHSYHRVLERRGIFGHARKTHRLLPET